jgi:hypothetical protein
VAHSSWFLGVILALVTPATAIGQTVCRPADSLATEFRTEISRYSAASYPGDAVVRDSLRLPAVPASQVVLIGQEATCKKARDAYQQELVGSGGGAFSGRVYVLKVGTAYAVLDPVFKYDPNSSNWVIVIMDSRFKKLSLF